MASFFMTSEEWKKFRSLEVRRHFLWNQERELCRSEQKRQKELYIQIKQDYGRIDPWEKDDTKTIKDMFMDAVARSEKAEWDFWCEDRGLLSLDAEAVEKEETLEEEDCINFGKPIMNEFLYLEYRDSLLFTWLNENACGDPYLWRKYYKEGGYEKDLAIIYRSKQEKKRQREKDRRINYEMEMAQWLIISQDIQQTSFGEKDLPTLEMALPSSSKSMAD